MAYYSIHSSYNKKVIGNYPQQIDSKIDGSFLSKMALSKFFLKRIDFQPLIPNAILHKNSNLTDLIKTEGMGFTFSILVSTKLKSILEKGNSEDFQFFRSDIYKEDKIIEDYWLINPTNERMEKIDYKQSTFNIINKKTQTLVEKIDVDSYNDFQEIKENLKREGYKGVNEKFVLQTEKLQILKTNPLPFIYLRVKTGGRFYVSEEIKNEIEKSECTGIEFFPSDISYVEWIKPNGYLEQTYGYR